MEKWLQLYCPTCEFPHNFKRTSWYDRVKYWVAHYTTDDMKSTKACKQELIFGTLNYKQFSEVFDNTKLK